MMGKVGTYLHFYHPVISKLGLLSAVSLARVHRLTL